MFCRMETDIYQRKYHKMLYAVIFNQNAHDEHNFFYMIKMKNHIENSHTQRASELFVSNKKGVR